MRIQHIPLFFVLGACAVIEQLEKPKEKPQEPVEVAVAQPAPPPPSNARTVEQFDTTTQAQREAATQVSTGGTLLGETVATLGDAASPGFWIETPLVDAVGKGRVVYPTNGNSVEVELRPIEGGSSRISLAALRLLEAPLTDLVTLEVYRN